MVRYSRSARVVAVVAGLLASGLHSSFSQSRQPTFRSSVQLLPVDVRVVDRSGNAVRGLRREDFTLLEDGIPQTVSEFAIREHDRVPIVTGEMDRASPFSAVHGASEGVRTFVIVLGRGRLAGPSKGLKAVQDFVRSSALANDRFGLVAYDRATELGVSPDTILRLLDRYAEHHEDIDARLAHWFEGLTEVFGERDPPPDVRRRIDSVMQEAGLPALRRLAQTPPPGGEDVQAEYRRALRASGGIDAGEGGFIYFGAARQDLERLHATIEYIRPLAGEKHILFLTENGFVGPERDHIDRLSRLAADARISISPIHTGGLATSWGRGSQGIQRVFNGPSWSQRWANSSSRDLAKATGGLASIYEFADRALQRIDRATRVTYLLGYYPSVLSSEEFRDIEVRVNRRDVDLLYRRTYYARPGSPPYDHRTYLTAERIRAAKTYGAPLTDIPIEHIQTEIRDGVTIRFLIGPRSIGFVEREGRFVGMLTAVCLIGDEDGRVIGQQERQIDLRLPAREYESVQSKGLSITMTLPVRGEARHVKIVVYDYVGDRLGSSGSELSRNDDR